MSDTSSDSPKTVSKTARVKDVFSKPYVILTGALVHRVGKEKDEVSRNVRGQVVKFNKEFTNVERLLKLGAISEHSEGKQYRAPTARQLAQNAGAADDPVKAPDADVQPADESTTPADSSSNQADTTVVPPSVPSSETV